MAKAAVFIAVLCLLARQSSGLSANILNVAVTWNNRGTQTDFTVTSALGNGVSSSNAWIGVGLLNSASGAMMGADVIVCMNNGGTTSIQHNYNNNYASSLMASGTPLLGITNGNVQVVGSNLTCSYTRDNSNSNSNYYNLNTNQSPYIVVAYGTLSSGSMVQHSSSNRGYSSAQLSFAVATTTQAPTTTSTTTRSTTTTATTTPTTTTTTMTPTTTTTRSSTPAPTTATTTLAPTTTTTRNTTVSSTSTTMVSSTTRNTTATAAPSTTTSGPATTSSSSTTRSSTIASSSTTQSGSTTRAASSTTQTTTRLVSTITSTGPASQSSTGSQMTSGMSSTTTSYKPDPVTIFTQALQNILNKIFQLFGIKS